MLFKLISRTLPVAIVVMAGLHLQSNLREARADIPALLKLDQTGCCNKCPACNYVCKLDAELVDEKKTCFDVETKVICIPRVVFPWQKKKCMSCTCDGVGCTSCVNNGARTRRIRVLKTDSYTCPKCEYSWTAEKVGCDPCISSKQRSESAPVIAGTAPVIAPTALHNTTPKLKLAPVAPLITETGALPALGAPPIR